MLRGVQLGGGMGGLVARVGTPRVELMAPMGSLCLVVPMQKFCHGSPPQLRGMQEGGGGGCWSWWLGWALTKL